MLKYVFNKQFFCLLVSLIFLWTLAGCSSSDDNMLSEPDSDENPIVDSQRTILVYMVANNNLNNFATLDLNEMRKAMQSIKNPTGRLLVYYAPSTHDPQLLEVLPNGNTTILKQYDSSLASVSIDRMQQAIADTKSIAPAPAYGLILWSHGSGWMSEGGTMDEPVNESGISTQSFGADGYFPYTKHMSIPSLARAIDGTDWDFIYFDCCHMATVEVAYELRHVTHYIIASPAEIGGEGMPYDLNIPELLQSEPQLLQAMNHTFDYYRDCQPSTGDGGCTISLINTSHLDELAVVTREIYGQYGSVATSYTPVTYCRSQLTGVTGIYDMYDYISALCSDDILLSKWRDAFGRVVSDNLSTNYVYFMSTDQFHGLGTNILYQQSESSLYDYDTMQWWQDVAACAFQP